MNWASATEFWAMGGYGLYVWGSYAVMLVCLVVEIALARGRFGGVLKRLGRSNRVPGMGSQKGRDR